VSKPVLRATAFIGAQGYYVLMINGLKVGDAELDPGWSTYSKTQIYSAMDVTN